MPIRQGKAKLWFNTKEEQDEYDDKMISNILLQSNNPDDDNYNPVFIRKRQEFFIQLSDQAKSQISKLQVHNLSQHIDKYYNGKRDHTFWRQWTVQKFGIGYAISYLLLRELPVRNFYARAWIMLFFLGKINETFIRGFYFADQDEWKDKAIRNYGVYQTMKYNTAPTVDGKLPEQALWKLNQPGYLRYNPRRYPNTAFMSVMDPEPKVIQWDGTFNMPLDGLAHPRSKDCKFVDFIYE